jgi:hypothetical protein
VHHDAAWDALNQAEAVIEAYRRLGLAPPPQSPREDATNSGAVHHLKTWPVQFQAIKRGDKGFELRVNDRDFREGDTLILLEWDPCRGDGAYTGDWLAYRAGWILYGGKPEFGCAAMPADHCIISLARHPSVRPIGRLAA